MANYQLGFLDLETVSQYPNFEAVPQRDDELYHKRYDHEFIKDGWHSMDEHYVNKAGLYAEFGKVVCMVIAFVDSDEKLKVKTLCGRHEKPLLSQAAEILTKFNSLVAHNGKDFDFPFLSRRMVINGIDLPPVLQTIGKKPWETSFYDTMEMWAFNQWKYKCSIDLIAHCLGLPSPKQDMSGADVGRVYWDMFKYVKGDELPFDAESAVIQRIGKYCQRDVVTLVNVYRKLNRMAVIAEENVIYTHEGLHRN